MSILIKGMELPKNCFECPWRCKADPENLLCRISGEYFEETFSDTIQNRHKSCPLVPIPPHGRLIDADALAAVAEKRMGIINIGHIDDAPTVIEAEKGET